MNKLYLTLIIATLLIGVVFAGIITTTNPIIILDKISDDTIKNKLGITEIKPIITKNCYDKQCIVTLNQEKLLGSNVIVIDRYKYDCILTDINKLTEVCNLTLKTDLEIDKEILNKTKEILNNYADAINIRNGK